jgi:hypothetical protein
MAQPFGQKSPEKAIFTLQTAKAAHLSGFLWLFQ